MIPEIVVACIDAQLHLTSCDNDGYCNYCGHQDSPDWDEYEEALNNYL